MFNMIIMLLAMLNSEPIGTNDYRISRFILSNLEEIQQYNISQLAKACFVSVSSISRYCRKIGFQDFNELKQQFYQWEDIGERKFHYAGQSNQIFDSYFDSVIQNLQLMRSSIDQQALQNLAADIISYPNVAAFGTLHSQSVVLNLQADLLTSGIVMDTRTRFQEQLEYIEKADQDTLILLFSRGGSHLKRFLIHNLQLSMKQKPKMIMLTANQAFQSNKYIDQVISYQELPGYSSYPFAFQLINSVVALEVHQRVQAKKQEMDY